MLALAFRAWGRGRRSTRGSAGGSSDPGLIRELVEQVAHRSRGFGALEQEQRATRLARGGSASRYPGHRSTLARDVLQPAGSPVEAGMAEAGTVEGSSGDLLQSRTTKGRAIRTGTTPIGQRSRGHIERHGQCSQSLEGDLALAS